MVDKTIIDTEYFKKPILSSYVKLVHTFEDDRKWNTYLLTKISGWFNKLVPTKNFIFDVNDDGQNDVNYLLGKGYAQKGINSATPFIALTVKDGELIFDEDINSTMPIDAAAGRSKTNKQQIQSIVFIQLQK